MKFIINKIIAVSFLGLLVSNVSFAEPKANDEFENGSAVILCEREKPAPESDFQKIFGHWLTYITTKHEEGTVYLSQFTKTLTQGIVIVVNKHEAIADNVKESNKMLDEMHTIAIDSGVERDKSACKVLEMGPIWLPPKK